MSNTSLKAFVRGAYDLQKMRMQAGNRICAEFRAQHGLEPSDKIEKIDKDGKNTIRLILASYKRLTDGLVKLPPPARFKGDELISSYTLLCLVDYYVDLEKKESNMFRQLGNILKEYPIYTEFLEGVRGVGPAMAGVIISEFDITKATYSSSLFKYAGVDCVIQPDGSAEGRTREKRHLVEKEYIDKEGEINKKMGITFNPFLKTKLVGVLGSSFIKQPADKCKYREIYDQYKHRLQNMPAHSEKSKLHIHNMANRYMIKLFLVDLYNAWRPLEGLECYGTYAEDKLNIHHKKVNSH